MKNNNILVPIIVAIVVGAAAFFGGMQYQKSQSTNPLTSANGQNRQFAGRAGGAGGAGQGRGFAQGNRPVMGEILSTDDKTVTIKLQDGSTKIVLLSDTTSINKATAGTKADLVVGLKVSAFGTTNSDGSVTAQNIQLNPQMGKMKMMPSGTPAAK